MKGGLGRVGCLGICISNKHPRIVEVHFQVSAAATRWLLKGTASHL